MTLHARVLTMALGAVLVARWAPALAGPPTPHPIPPACQQALAYEKIAANDSLAAQAAYDAAVAGLEVNQRCSDEPMRLTREAYLLSMRAAAEYALNIGNWRRDLSRAGMLLANCANRLDIARSVGDDCRRQARYNADWLKKTLAQPTPTPRPYATQPPGSSSAPPRPVIAPPPTPNPSPRP